jgi:hypothetical protein
MNRNNLMTVFAFQMRNENDRGDDLIFLFNPISRETGAPKN